MSESKWRSSKMEAELHAELAGDVQRFIRAKLLLGGDAIDRKARRFVTDRGVAHVPVQVVRFHRPVPGHLISGTRAEPPSRMLRERNVAEAVDGKRRRGP